MNKLINVDNGGTLTDIWVLDGEKSYHTKTLTTPHDLSRCFMSGLRKISQSIYGSEDLDRLISETDLIRYSTTVGTNALVQRKGPAIGLIIDEEFPIDALLADVQQQEMFSAIVGDRHCRFNCSLEGDLYRAAVVAAINELCAKGAQRLVIAFSQQGNAEAEKRFQKSAMELFPRHLLGAVPMLFVHSLVADRDPIRRCWTGLNNAFLHPAMEGFLYYAENLLREARARHPLLIYRNDGFSGRVSKTVAVRTYSSGPRGGMEGIAAYAAHYGLNRVLSFDVGGTTTDIGLVELGAIRTKPYGEVEGVPCSMPLCDIKSVGVGGGSVIRVIDGQIRVGPDSVGASPGPACFALGGTDATITDALVVLGLLDPDTYFGGDLKLDRARAVAAVAKHVADPLDLTPVAAAQAMLRAWAGNIATDLRHFAEVDAGLVLAAFGGGGPLAASEVADALGVEKVLIPRTAAVFSANGIGFSDVAHTAQAALSSAPLPEQIAQLRSRAISDMFSEGFEAAQCTLSVWLTNGEQAVAIAPDASAVPAECRIADDWTLHVRACGAVPQARICDAVTAHAAPAKSGGNRSLLQDDGTSVSVPVIVVEDQLPGAFGCGPAVIEEAFWTSYVRPGWRYEFSAAGDILLERIK